MKEFLLVDTRIFKETKNLIISDEMHQIFEDIQNRLGFEYDIHDIQFTKDSLFFKVNSRYSNQKPPALVVKNLDLKLEKVTLEFGNNIDCLNQVIVLHENDAITYLSKEIKTFDGHNNLLRTEDVFNVKGDL